MYRILLIFFFLVLFISCKSKKGDEQNQFSPLSQSDSNPSDYLEDFPKPANWPWRGISIVSHIDRDSITEPKISGLASQGVNLIRLRLSFRRHAQLNGISVEQSISDTFKWSDSLIKWSGDNDIAVLISHSDFPIDPKLGFDQSSDKFWDSEKHLNDAIEIITSIVEYYDHFENVVGYEFLAEPVIVNSERESSRPDNWLEFFKRTLSFIRDSSKKYVLFTPGPWGLPAGYLDWEDLIADERIVYNFHFYSPHRFTHQNKKGLVSFSYPGMVGSKYWDKDELERQVEYVTDWANNNKVNLLYAGEFGAVKWAEGRNTYLKDLLDIFEKEDIAWSYFCYNGWQGWTYFEDEKSKTNTEILLENYWELNKKR